MAACIPQISSYIEATRRDPSLLGNLEFFLEDFMARMNYDSCKNSPGATNSAHESDHQEASSETPQNDPNTRPANFFDILINNARETIKEATGAVTQTKDQDNTSNTQQGTNEPLEKSSQEELPIPITSNTSWDYEFKFNFEGCASDSIRLEVEGGLIKATAKKEEDEGVKTISYEKNLPSDIDSSSMKASFMADGTLKIVGKKIIEALVIN